MPPLKLQQHPWRTSHSYKNPQNPHSSDRQCLHPISSHASQVFWTFNNKGGDLLLHTRRGVLTFSLCQKPDLDWHERFTELNCKKNDSPVQQERQEQVIFVKPESTVPQFYWYICTQVAFPLSHALHRAAVGWFFLCITCDKATRSGETEAQPSSCLSWRLQRFARRSLSQRLGSKATCSQIEWDAHVHMHAHMHARTIQHRYKKSCDQPSSFCHAVWVSKPLLSTQTLIQLLLFLS